MNIQELRESLKLKWVKYYYKNRPWLTKMRIWGTYDGQRRPSSGFILATLSVLEPQLDQILPFVLELNSNPDQIVAALGLNFNPEEQLHLIREDSYTDEQHNSDGASVVMIFPQRRTHRSLARKLYPVPQPTLSTVLQLSERRMANHGFSANCHTDYDQSLVSSQFTSEAENNSKPVPLLRVITNTESSTKPLPSVALVSEIESKGKLVKTPHKDLQDTFNSSLNKKVCKFTSWLDEFCQGVGWEQEEAIFIPF